MQIPTDSAQASIRSNRTGYLRTFPILFAVALTIFLTFGSGLAFADEVPYEGQTEQGSYAIAEASQLKKLADTVNSGATNYAGSTFILTQDIDLSSVCGPTLGAGNAPVSWQPIGDRPYFFAGTFDGSNKRISGLYLDSRDTTSLGSSKGGLFNNLTGAAVKNLTLAGDILAKRNVGALAGVATNTVIENCTNEVAITTDYDYTGGILYQGNKVTITDCTNTATLRGNDYVAGIISRIFEGDADTNTISGCENYGTLEGISLFGILCETTVDPAGTDVGVTIKDCKNYADIDGSLVAGIAGDIRASDSIYLEKCENFGNLTATSIVSGVAMALSGEISACVNYGNLTQTRAASSSSNYCSGIIGWSSSSAFAMSGCENFGDLTGSINVGGLVGTLFGAKNKAATVSGSANFGNIQSLSNDNGSEGNLGGLIGQVGSQPGDNIRVSDVYSTGSIDAPDISRVGGLIGSIKPLGSSCFSLSYAYNAGSVRGLTHVGGLVGIVEDNTNPSDTGSDDFDVTIENVYSVASEVISTTAGSAALGICSVGGSNSLADSVHVSNVFVCETGTDLPTVVTDTTGLDGGVFVPLPNSRMQDQGFTALMGGAFIRYSSAIFGDDTIDQEVLDGYSERYGEYSYPILRSFVGLEKELTHNLRFAGAQHLTVTVNGQDSWATTVSPGEKASFTIESRYPDDVIVDSVKLGDETLQPSDDGSYTIEDISAYTVVTVITTGEPPAVEPVVASVTFEVTDKDAAPIGEAGVTVTSGDVEYSPDDEGKYALDEGTYTAKISAEGYHSVEGSFKVADTDRTLTVVLYQGEIHKTIIDAGPSELDFSVLDVHNGDLRIASHEMISYVDNYLEIMLPEGSYRYEGSDSSGVGVGGGSFTVEGETTFNLAYVDFAGNLNSLQGVSNYTMTMEAATGGEEYWPGSLDAQNGGAARGHFIVPTEKYGKKYRYTFVPVNETVWGGSGDIYLYDGMRAQRFPSLNLSDSGSFILVNKGVAAFTVPEGSGFQVYHRVKFYMPLEDIYPISSVNNGDGTLTYTYEAPVNAKLHYELELEGYVKQARSFTVPTKTKFYAATVSPENLMRTKDAPEKNDDTDSNFICNLPNSRYLELPAGECYEAYFFRNWQATDSVTDNYYVDPSYEIEVVSGDSVEVVDPFYAGAVIKAKEGTHGVSVVRVTYGALDFADTMTADRKIYSPLLEENTLYVIVNVEPQGTATINTGIPHTEFDKSYFIRSLNDIVLPEQDQYAEHTFTPTVEGGELEGVYVHAPVGNGEVWDAQAWDPVTANDDGSYTVKLYKGYNYVRVRATDGAESYHAIKATFLDVTATGASASLDGRTFTLRADMRETEEVAFRFKGLQNPISKQGALYNPGYPDTGYLMYDLVLDDMGIRRYLKSDGTQYGINEGAPTTMTLESPGTYTLTDGHIHMGAIGGGGHTKITKGGRMPSALPYFVDDGQKISNDIFCYFPEIKLVVIGEPDKGVAYEATLTVPEDASSVVKDETGYYKAPVSSEGGTYRYELTDNGNTATYRYFVERPGYLSKAGSFEVSGSNVAIDLTQGWESVAQEGGKVYVSLKDALRNFTDRTVSFSTDQYDSLAYLGYTEYDSGGYTALHAAIDAMNTMDPVWYTKTKFTVKNGKFITVSDITPTAASATRWAVSVNGVDVEDYANTLVNAGDKITVYLKKVDSPPVLKPGVPSTAEASVKLGESYTLDLSTIFEDADGDALTYTVSIDGAPAVAAAGAYSFTPEAEGMYTLVFRANDGDDESIDSYTVTLNVSITASIIRLSGKNAADTAAAISQEAFPDGAETVIIARADDFADAMSAAGLAGVLDAPILLTDRNSLSAATAEEIQRLGALQAYIIGGAGAITPMVNVDLAELDIKVKPRVSGKAAWDTSVACANLIGTLGGAQDKVIVAMSTNFQDALSISSFAYAHKVPIYLQTATGDRPLPSEAVEAIKASPEATIFVPGGNGAVKPSTVEEVFGNEVVRIAGKTGYDTSNEVARYMVENQYLSASKVSIASGALGVKGVDALAGAALAGRAGGVLLLTNGNAELEPINETTLNGFLTDSATQVEQAYVLGGNFVVPPAIYDKIVDVLS